MALTPSMLDKLPESMVQLMSELENEIISDICRRVAKANYLTSTAEWQLIKANQLTLSSREVKKRIARILKKSEKEVKDLYTEAVRTAIAEDEKIYKFAISDGILSDDYREKLTNYTRSTAFSNALKKGLKNTNGLLRNLTNSAAAMANKQLSDALDLAYLKVVSGAFTPQDAIFDAVKKLGADGIKCVRYEPKRPGRPGRTEQLDVAVRRAVITGVGKTCGDLQLGLAKEMDSNLVEVSSHLGARPSHAEWQGRIYSLIEDDPRYPYFYDATGYGTGDGLCGWNCRHSFFPYFDGLSTPANEPDFSSEENLKAYRNEQKQRGYERAIRKSKRELAALDGARSSVSDSVQKAKLDREFERKSATLKRRETRLSEHLKATGLLPDNSRVRVDGFNKSVSQKAVHAAKRYTAPTKTVTIKQGNKYRSEYKANHEIIENKEYLHKFKGITSTSSGDNSVGKYCRNSILNNDGKATETAYILSSKNGKLRTEPINLNEFGGSLKLPIGKDNSFIIVHNHPNSTAPSFDDFVALNNAPELKTLIAAGHDGTVYMLSVGKGKRLDLSDNFKVELARMEWQRCYRDLNGDLGALTHFCNEYGWDLNVR